LVFLIHFPYSFLGFGFQGIPCPTLIIYNSFLKKASYFSLFSLYFNKKALNRLKKQLF